MNESGHNRLYKAGAIALLVGSVLGFFLFFMSLRGVQYSLGVPTDPASQLQLLSNHSFFYAIHSTLWITDDLITIIPAIAIYFVLRRINKAAAFIGLVISLAYVPYDIFVSDANSLHLNILAQAYTAATSPALQAHYVAAASSGFAALPLEAALSYAIGSLGYLIYSALMRSSFGKATAVLGIVVNAAAIVGAAGTLVPASGISSIFGLLELFAVPLTAVWTIIVGVKLYRFPRRSIALAK